MPMQYETELVDAVEGFQVVQTEPCIAAAQFHATTKSGCGLHTRVAQWFHTTRHWSWVSMPTCYDRCTEQKPQM